MTASHNRIGSPRPITTVALVSLGCPKNLVDSEKMLGLLAEAGLVPVSDETEADAIVVNTCGFLEASRQESLTELHRAAQLKDTGRCQRLVVAGCLVQRHRARLLDWCPQIDAMVGVFDRDRIVDAVRVESRPRTASSVELPVYSSIAANAQIAKRDRNLDAEGYFESDAARLRLTPRHYAYLRVSEGCNQNCTFCTIPSIRGKMRSKTIDALTAEALELMMDGAFELNLIGQDTTSYGQDINYEHGLAGMLETLDSAVTRNSGGGWLRLMYAYPSCFTDAMIDAIGRLEHVVKYVDMPLQHINDRILKTMRRNTTRRQIEMLLDKLRRRVPGIAVRTTFISGFPGETNADHDELVEFVGNFNFDAMGVFAYSPEPGTPAGAMHASGEAVDDEIIKQRIDELMLTQQQIVFDRNAELARCGAEFDVLIDKSGELCEARHAGQAPQIDGVTRVRARRKLSPGELVCCRITEADGYDLIAQPVDEVELAVALPVVG